MELSSPGCANFGLLKTAQEGEAEFGEDAANFLRNDFYVDDGLKSVKTTRDAVDLVTKSKEMCAKSGLRLHKFASNSVDVLEAIQVDDRAKDIKNLEIGDIVIDKDDDLPGNQWLLARVIKTLTSEDGLVRKVEIEKATRDLDRKGRRKTQLNRNERPIHKLVVLVERKKEKLKTEGKNPIEEP